ncbi:unnamed protein product [Symbiodinium sp. CCMP2592]|nr:unnamed protein product [Symbiodinium sp. CCMP2592]
MALQETHWSIQGEWQSGDWYLVHSPAPKPKQGGVLLGIRKDLLASTHYSWNELVPGRLLHWRGCIGKQACDIFNMYQHALTHKTEEQKQMTMKNRRGVWQQLDRALSALPFRSSIVLLGDFNMVLQPLARVSGKGIHLGSQNLELRQERSDVMEILERHRLVALNTWGKKQCTYKHPSGNSQIDYVLIRQQQADKISRTCGPVSAPIASWRTAGHEILLASFPQSWQPWKTRDHRAAQAGHSAKSLETIAGMQQPSLAALQASLQQHHNVSSVKLVKPALRDVNGEVLAIWRDLARARFRYSRDRLGRLFGAWQLALLKIRARRNIKRIARQRKREQILSILAMAESAGEQHQSRDYYKYVRMLAPKTQNRKICLRDSDGQLQNPAQECDQLTTYVQGLFAGPAYELPDLAPLPEEWFVAPEWEDAIKHMKSHKAVQLAWLPKPGKSTAIPANLRTIGLMGCDSKAWLYILKKHANPFVQTALRDIPQYAYRVQASTSDPLLRASKHCHTVREMLASCQDDLTSRLANQNQTLLIGGMMASLDLSKAFDSITHEEMYLALIDTGMPENLAGMLLRIHMNTTLHVVHKGCERKVSMGKDLRQGCGVAPMIYAAWTCRLCKQLAKHLGVGWHQRHKSIYADDKHGFWEIRSLGDLDKARKALGTMIQVITSLGMTVNSAKSRIVIALKGICT